MCWNAVGQRSACIAQPELHCTWWHSSTKRARGLRGDVQSETACRASAQVLAFGAVNGPVAWRVIPAVRQPTWLTTTAWCLQLVCSAGAVTRLCTKRPLWPTQDRMLLTLSKVHDWDSGLARRACCDSSKKVPEHASALFLLGPPPRSGACKALAIAQLCCLRESLAD